MPYLGRPVTNAGQFEIIDDISSDFDGSETSFSLKVGGTDIQPDVANVTITLGGVYQVPASAYSITGSTINFSEAPESSTAFHGVLAGQSQFIESDFITNTMIKSTANISGSKINTDFSGKTVKAAIFDGMVSSSAQIADNISGSLSQVHLSSKISGIVSASSIASSAQGQVALTTNGIAATAVDLGLQTGDSPTFAGGTITGDFSVGGTLTAQEVHTEFESASILFTSGSTQFGNSSDDVHEFKGNTISGSVSSTGSFGSLVTAGLITATTSGGEVSTDANGHITSFQKLDVATAGGRLIGKSNRGTLGRLMIEQTANSTDGGYIRFETSPNGSTTPTEKMRITEDGKVGIGTNDPESLVHILGADSTQSGTSRVQLTITDDAAYNSAQYSGIAFSQKWHSDGRDTPTSAIIGSRDSTSSGQYGGYLTFHTRTQGDNVAERMRIDSSGNVGIGTDNPSYELDVYSSGTADVRISGGTQPRLILYDTGGTSGAKNWDIKVSDDVFQIRNISDDMGSVENTPFTANTNGNVGIGVSPSATNTSHDCLQIGGNASILSYGTQGASGEMDINHNVLYNQAGNYVYISTDEATRYRQSSGKHLWYVAASGTAGNTISFSEAMQINNSGYVGIGTDSPEGPFHVHSPDGANYAGYTMTVKNLEDTANRGNTLYVYGGNNSVQDAVLRVDTRTQGTALTCLGTGAVGVGLTLPNVPFHVRKAGNGKAGNIARFAQENDSDSVLMYGRGSGAYGASSADACMAVATMETSGRSINAGGTINASGADYAEYETKRADCGTIEKGDIVGFDTNGLITDKWTNAVTFGIKSTNPSYVGGDTWGVGVSSGSIETERQKVDRIAYSGKVPCNVTGSNVGDYIIPIQVGDGIGGVAKSSPTYDEYKQSVGVVRTISGSLPIVVVKTL